MRQSLFAPRQWLVVLCGAAALLLSAGAYADPPGRVARLTQIEGTISFSPAGEEDWAIAEANRPVTTGDRVWSDANSHVELQIGDASTRLGANTAVTVLNLDDRIGQFQLAQGTLNVRVKRVSGDQFYEIDTPTLAFSIRQAGDYRVDVDPDGNTSVIQVRAGSGEAWGEGTAYTIDAGQQYTFTGEGIRDVRYDAIPAADRFDQWCFDRNRREDAATAARYVSPEVVGYSDLDEYGTWRNVENYGTVWVPTRVQADWVPYHYGRWAWVEPWGWTWVDDQPWGFAPFHYGRWAYLSSRWCWVPGPVVARPVYAPALVAFVGGGGFSIAVGGGSGVGWFPLGVGEVYRPSYEVSRTYFTNVNVTNTVVNTTYVTNVYNNQNVEINYRNRQVAGAVTAVPVNAFASGERVDRHAVRVQPDAVARAEVAPAPRVTPTRAAVLATAAVAGTAVAVASHRPPERVLSRQVVARTEPPPPRASFAARERLLAEQPGRPLDQEKMRSVRAERPAEAPKVKVVTPNVQPRPVEAAKGGPRATPQGAPTAQEERAMKDRQGRPEAGPQANAPQPPANAQERMRGGPQGAPQGPTAQEERAMKDRRGRPEAAGPQANAPQPPANAQDRMRGGPQGGPQGPTAQEERGMKDRRGRPEAAGPQANAPQPPASAQDRFKGGPQGAPQGPTAQEERAMKERRGAPQAGPQANAPQPPTTAQERMKGGPQGAQAAQERAQQERAQQQGRAQQDRAQQDRAQQDRAQQDRAQQERAQQERARQQQERGQQERSQAERSQQQAQQQRAQQQAQQRAQQERGQAQAQQQRAEQERAQQQAQQQRAQQERAQAQAQQQRGQQERAQQQAQQQRAQQERAQAQAQQQRAQQDRAQAQAQQQRTEQQAAQQQRAQQQAQQQRAPQEQRREEPKGRGQTQQEKDKDKEPRG